MHRQYKVDSPVVVVSATCGGVKVRQTGRLCWCRALHLLAPSDRVPRDRARCDLGETPFTVAVTDDVVCSSRTASSWAHGQRAGRGLLPPYGKC